MARLHRAAWVLIVIADAGLLAWGAMAALLPEYLLGPGGVPILAAGYEGYTGGSWTALVAAFPGAPGFMTTLFRVYGAYIIAFSYVPMLGAQPTEDFVRAIDGALAKR